MSFREKLHWAAFVSLLAGFGWYFLTFPWGAIDDANSLHLALRRMGVVAAIVLGGMSLAFVILKFATPKDPVLREDERESSVHRKGTHVAYYALVLGAWTNVFAGLYGITGTRAVVLLIATVAIAELIRVGAQLVIYRRSH